MPNSYDDKLLNGAGLSYFWGIVKGYLDAKPGEIVIQNGAVKGEVFNNGANAAADQNTATGVAAHAEGKKTVSSNIATHAEGQNTTASGTYGAHAEGDGCTASGSNGSHAEGKATVASGFAAHAEGGYTEAKSAYQHVQGKYNTIDASSKYAFIIGNGTGTSSNKRSNAFCIDWDGKIYVNNAATGVDVSTLGTGTVTSVGITAGTGVSVSGSPVTSSGSITVGLDMDSTVTSGGTKPVTGGAVYNAVSAKATVADIYGRGTAISSGDSLNDYTTVGTYYCSSTNCNSVTPRPEDIIATAFKLIVSEISTTDGTRIIQDIFPVNSDTTAHYRRNKGNNYSETSGWRPWVKMVTDAELTTSLATKQDTLQFETRPTASSTKMVNSGGIFAELYNLPVTVMPSGSDLNSETYRVPGVYMFKGSGTVYNCPHSSGGFKLEVLETWTDNSNKTRILQRIWAGGQRYYMRGWTGTAWNSWYEFAGAVASNQGTQPSGTSSVGDETI